MNVLLDTCRYLARLLKLVYGLAMPPAMSGVISRVLHQFTSLMVRRDLGLSFHCIIHYLVLFVLRKLCILSIEQAHRRTTNVLVRLYTIE